MKRIIAVLFVFIVLFAGCFPETYISGSAVPMGGNLSGSATTIGDATNSNTQLTAAIIDSHPTGGDTTLGIQAGNLNMGWNNITNVGLVDGVDVSTLAPGLTVANIFNVAKSGASYTTIQSAINAAAADSPSATSPKLVRIAPGVYDEAITLVSYVHLAAVGGSYGTVIVQRTDADICTLPSGVNNISGITFRLVTPTGARTIFKDNGNANVCYMENCVIEITTPSTYAHKLIAISGTGTVLVLTNFYANVGGTGDIHGIDISSAAVVSSSGMQITINNVNAADLACSHSGAVVSMMNSVLGGTATLFHVTGGTYQWTGCRLTATNPNVVNTDSTHYAENCFIDSPVSAGNGAEVRLRNCSYKYVLRTGTGNIIETTRKMQEGIFHVVNFTWNTLVASGNVAIRKNVDGDVLNGGSGQGTIGVQLNKVAYAGVENAVDVTGALDSSFTCARTIRMSSTYSISSFPANGKIFIGVRQTLGNAVPTLTGAENYAGLVWNGTNWMCQSSNGGGTGQSTTLASYTSGVQHTIEIEVLGSKRVDFYRDGILVASHSTATGLPSGLVDWQRLATADGGGANAFMYVTLRTGFIEECPQ
jgi:hypothetical protein